MGSTSTPFNRRRISEYTDPLRQAMKFAFQVSGDANAIDGAISEQVIALGASGRISRQMTFVVGKSKAPLRGTGLHR